MQASRIWTLVNKAAIGSGVLFENGYVQSWLCKHNMSTDLYSIWLALSYLSIPKGGLYD